MSLLLSLLHQCKPTVDKESLVTYLFYFIYGATDTPVLDFWVTSLGFKARVGGLIRTKMEEASRRIPFFSELSVIMLGGTHVTITWYALPSVQGSPQPPETDPPHMTQTCNLNPRTETPHPPDRDPWTVSPPWREPWTKIPPHRTTGLGPYPAPPPLPVYWRTHRGMSRTALCSLSL